MDSFIVLEAFVKLTLSPLLFIIVIEAFCKLIFKAIEEHLIEDFMVN